MNFPPCIAPPQAPPKSASAKKSVRWQTLSIAVVVCLILGCTRSGSLDTSYGVSHGRSGRISINGFGGLRDGYHAAGWRSRTINRLGDRMLRLDAMVWTPSEPSNIRREETQWFEDWLSGGGKTLVYVIHDGGSEADYWRNASRLAPPEQRFEYRRREARAQYQRGEFLRSHFVSSGNGWFQTAQLPFPQAVGQTKGPWAADRAANNSAADDDDDDAQTVQQAEAIRGIPHGELQVLFQVTGSSGNDSLSNAKVSARTMLSTAEGTPLVTRISSPSWKKSQVLVVTGGSLANNYGLTTSTGRRLGARLIAASGTPGEVGFLVSGASGVRISDSVTEENRKTGMELLTVWPISLVTIHLALLGLVVCLILWPIFGRPRKEQTASQSDFADHINAIATLMTRMDSDDYARQRISLYMRRVRGETHGPWVLPEAPHHPTHSRS